MLVIRKYTFTLFILEWNNMDMDGCKYGDLQMDLLKRIFICRTLWRAYPIPQPYLYLLHVQFRINPFIMMASEVDGNMNSVVEFLNFEKLLIWPHLFKKPHFIITSRSIFGIGMHV